MTQTSTETLHAGDDFEGLRDARTTDRLGPYLLGVWNRREWTWYVAASELRSRQVNSILGNLWHLLSPLLQVGVFFIFFGLILEVDRGVDNFIGYLAVGIFTYLFTQKATMAGGRSMTKYRPLMQLISFPRALMPVTATLTEALAAAPAFLVMFIVALSSGESPSLAWFLVAPVFAVQTAFNAGLALCVARAVSRVFDIQQVLPFIFRLGFYASGVLFNVNAYLEGNSLRILFELNPIYCFIEVNRGLVLGDQSVDWSLAVTGAIWAVAMLVVGLIWFRGAEDRYGDDR
ncbi:MAG: ABC transporter permease [Actinomycetota bacterium]